MKRTSIESDLQQGCPSWGGTPDPSPLLYVPGQENKQECNLVCSFLRKDFLIKLSDLGSCPVPGGVFCLITWPSRTMVAMVNLGMMQMNLVLWIHIWLWRNLEAVYVSGHGFAEELPRASHDTSFSGPVWTGSALDSKSSVSWSLFTSVSLSSIWASVF